MLVETRFNLRVNMPFRMRGYGQGMRERHAIEMSDNNHTYLTQPEIRSGPALATRSVLKNKPVRARDQRRPWVDHCVY